MQLWRNAFCTWFHCYQRYFCIIIKRHTHFPPINWSFLIRDRKNPPFILTVRSRDEETRRSTRVTPTSIEWAVPINRDGSWNVEILDHIYHGLRTVKREGREPRSRHRIPCVSLVVRSTHACGADSVDIVNRATICAHADLTHAHARSPFYWWTSLAILTAGILHSSSIYKGSSAPIMHYNRRVWRGVTV